MSIRPIYDSPRCFQMWLWQVSHNDLVLRSNPSDSVPGRIEVLFKYAVAVALPAVFLRGLTIDETNPTPAALAVLGGAVDNDMSFFEVTSGESRGWVLAEGVYGRSDDGKHFDPPLFDGWAARPGVTNLFSTTSD